MSTLRVDNIQDQSGAERRGLKTYAIICDEKADTAEGGTFTSGAWRTRDLNTTIADPDSIVSIASNQFTLGAGSYLIEASAPGFDTDRHQARLYNVTTATVVQYGQNMYAHSTYNGANNATLFARVTIAGSTTFEIQHRCQTTKSNNGFGVDNSFGETSIFTIVKIFKEA